MLVVIASPYRGVRPFDIIEQNLEVAGRIWKRYYDKGILAVSLVLSTSPLGIVPASDKQAHELACKWCRQWIDKADEVHFYVPEGGDMSGGMKAEWVYALEKSKVVRSYWEEW